MGVLSHMLGNKSDDPIQRITDEFYTYQIAEELGSRFFPNERDELQMASNKLDIQLKRRQLGLPMTDDYYEVATNENKDFVPTGTKAVWGRKIADSIPNPTHPNAPTTSMAFFGALGHNPSRHMQYEKKTLRKGLNALSTEAASQRAILDAMGMLQKTSKKNFGTPGAKGFLGLLKGVLLKK